MKLSVFTILFLACLLHLNAQQPIKWTHLSSSKGDIEVPTKGKEQTSAAVADFNNDGINDFCISERQQAPSMVMYLRNDAGWTKFPVNAGMLKIEAGTTTCDVDGDGDMDIIAGGDWQTNEVWWWENPYPNFDKNKEWNRYLIRNTGGTKIHDQMVGDFDGDGKTDVVFWAQGHQTLFFSRIPKNPKDVNEWKLISVYKYFADSQMEQRPDSSFKHKDTNEHEGLSKFDIDGDGVQDIIGGGMWFKYLGDDKFSFNTVDGSYSFSRSAAGQLIKGGRPEIIFVTGDGIAPMYMYEFNGKSREKFWKSKKIVDMVDNGHSLALVDFDGDGNLDIWNAEMGLGTNTDCINHILLGDGKGNFPREVIVSKGIDVHESEIADLDGDGDLDVLGKPYNGGVPRLDIWLQNGTGEIVAKRAGAFNQPVGLEIYSLRFELQKDLAGTLAKMKQMGFNDLEVSGYYGKTPKEFKKLLDQNKLKCGSMIFSYEQFNNNIETIISEAKLFGAKYVGVGWIPQKDGFTKALAEQACADFNKAGAKLKKAGLRFFYHPHGSEFDTPDGNLMDYILANTKPEFVTFQLDVFWATYGGADPIALLKNNPGRFELMHLKELRIDTPGNHTGGAADETSVSMGNGVTNWPVLLRQAVKSGTKKFYIEDEAKNAIDQIPPTIDYLNSLK